MSIVLEQLVKLYAGHPVVNNLSLEVADGELFVLLGPSGSGKSTVLRMIAGLAVADGGRISLHGRDVTHAPPQQRGIGLVFQHYALFRHMSVADNVEFGLRIRSVPSSERRRRRDELLEMVGLAGLGRRMPGHLSGGQQQRVALARALAHRPEVLLLDEPFGALDAKIRAELRRTIRGIQRELGITTIFVTHDQEEAFELADRIGIMDFGRLLEVGPPRELYLRPQTEFVATFLGAANLMVGLCSAEGVRLGPVTFPLGTETAAAAGPRRVQVLFRPEDVAVKDSTEALSWPVLGEAVVEESSFNGSFERLRLRLPSLAGVRPIHPPAPYGEDAIMVEAIRSQHQARRHPLRRGDPAWLGVRRIHALTHPGLSFLLVSDGSAASDGVLSLGGEMARMAHARVGLLAAGLDDPTARAYLDKSVEWIGRGLSAVESRSSAEPAARAVADEAARQPYDLVVAALPEASRVEAAERLLQAGGHHLLVVPSSSSHAPGPGVPSRVLICVAVGEPGKDDVQFAARLLRHIGAGATVMTVLPPRPGRPAVEQAERFLAAGGRTLSLMGVPSRTLIRTGEAQEQILEEIRDGAYGMIVLGTPPAGRGGRVALDGLTGGLLARVTDRALLIARSDQTLAGR